MLARRRLAWVALLLAGLAGGWVRVLPAQTIAAQLTAVDTVATVSRLTGTAGTFTVTVQVNIASCGKSGSSDCHAYMWGVPTGTTATNLRWSTTSSACASGRTIPTANPAAVNNTADRLLRVTAPATGSGAATSGAATVFVCHDATLNWSTAPTRLPYTLNFMVVRW